MPDPVVISQLALAAEWGLVGRSNKPNPLCVALEQIGYRPASDAVDDIAFAVVQSGTRASLDQLILASAHKPGRTWVARVAACLHLLLDDDPGTIPPIAEGRRTRDLIGAG